MPKIKTNRSCAKRFSLKPSGKIKRSQANKNHILTKKAPNRKRNLRRGTYVHPTLEKNILRTLGH